MKNSIALTLIALFSFVFNFTATADNSGYCNKQFYYETIKNGDIYPIGKDVYVRVRAQNYHDIDYMTLYINGHKIRREMNAPYEWGRPNGGGDHYLRNLPQGNYTLRCVVRTKCGGTYYKTINFYVKHGGGNNGGYCEQNYRYIYGQNGCQAGTDLYVKVGADNSSKVEWMELYLNGYKIRREMHAPYEWGRPNGGGDNLLRNMSQGTYQLRCKIKTKCGGVVWKEKVVYVN